jgi:hypothetical protein
VVGDVVGHVAYALLDPLRRTNSAFFHQIVHNDFCS